MSQNSKDDLLEKIVLAHDALINAEIMGRPDFVQAARGGLADRINELKAMLSNPPQLGQFVYSPSKLRGTHRR